MSYNPSYLAGPVFMGSQSAAQLWDLETTDDGADADEANYISDGAKRGMRVGDMVFVKKRASLPAGSISLVGIYYVSAVGTTAATITAIATAVDAAA